MHVYICIEVVLSQTYCSSMNDEPTKGSVSQVIRLSAQPDCYTYIHVTLFCVWYSL